MVSFVTMGAQLHNTLLPTRTWHCYSVIKNHRSRIFCLYTFSKRKGSLSWLSHGRGGGGEEKLVTKWGKSLSSLIKSACSVCHWLKNPPKMLNVSQSFKTHGKNKILKPNGSKIERNKRKWVRQLCFLPSLRYGLGTPFATISPFATASLFSLLFSYSTTWRSCFLCLWAR